jgi:hypothetical protein
MPRPKEGVAAEASETQYTGTYTCLCICYP